MAKGCNEPVYQGALQPHFDFMYRPMLSKHLDEEISRYHLLQTSHQCQWVSLQSSHG